MQADHFRTMNISFMHKNKVIWTARIRPKIGSCFPLIPYKCFLKLTIKKREELAKAQSKNTHCKSEMGKMHNMMAKTKHILAYPYVQINQIQQIITFGSAILLPINLRVKYKRAGTPIPKAQIITKAQRISYSQKKQPFHTYELLNFEQMQFEKLPMIPSKTTMVVEIHSGPYKSGLGSMDYMKSYLNGGINADLILYNTSASLTLKYSSQYFCFKNLKQLLSSCSKGYSLESMLQFQPFYIKGAFTIAPGGPVVKDVEGLLCPVCGEQLYISSTKSIIFYLNVFQYNF